MNLDLGKEMLFFSKRPPFIYIRVRVQGFRDSRVQVFFLMILSRAVNIPSTSLTSLWIPERLSFLKIARIPEYYICIADRGFAKLLIRYNFSTFHLNP